MANDLRRFGIRSRDNITFNEDGSLDIYLGPQCPDVSPESNWIPTLTGVIDLSIRLYTPMKKFRDDNWSPPVIQKIS